MTSKTKLLIAEDELSFAGTLNAYFTEKGYEVHLAVSGERCLQLIADVKPQILLLDLRFELGFVTGEEIVEKIKQTDPSLRIIVMTGYNVPETEQQIRQLGVFDFLHKPISLKQLEGIVKSAAEKSE